MLRAHFAGMTAALIAIAFATPTQAQQPAPPPFATTKQKEIKLPKYLKSVVLSDAPIYPPASRELSQKHARRSLTSYAARR